MTIIGAQAKEFLVILINFTKKFGENDFTKNFFIISGDPKFVDVMSGFEKDSINAKTMKMIRDKYLANTDINPDKSKSNLAAMDTCARAMYRWLLAIDMYEKVAKNIAPKRESLAKAEADYQESLEQLNKKKDNLR